MKSTLPITLLIFCTPLAFAGSPSEGKAVAFEDFWRGPVFGGGVKTNGNLTDGNLFLVAPLVDTLGEGSATEGSLLFLEPYGTWSDGGELGGSLGLGFRHLFNPPTAAGGLFGEGFYLGANLFVDYLETEIDNQFWQGGFGFEVGTRYLEFRGNYYAPFERSDIIGGGTTPTTTFERFEEALHGWDLELAWLVPWVENSCELRVIGGYYSYNGHKVPDIDGFRAGVEYRPVPALVLHATWFEDSKLYDDNWMAGVRVELPLGGDWKAAFTPRQRSLAERLFEPVRRKNSSITTETGETVSPVAAPVVTDEVPE